jgi:hypothetical protein
MFIIFSRFPCQRVDRLEVATNKNNNNNNNNNVAAAAAVSSSPSLPISRGDDATSKGKDDFADWAVTPSPHPKPPAATGPVPAFMKKGGFMANVAAVENKQNSSSNNNNNKSKNSQRKSHFPPGANPAETAVAQSLVQVSEWVILSSLFTIFFPPIFF